MTRAKLEFELEIRETPCRILYRTYAPTVVMPDEGFSPTLKIQDLHPEDQAHVWQEIADRLANASHEARINAKRQQETTSGH